MDLQTDLAAALRELLKESVKYFADSLGTILPKEPIAIAYMVPTGPGRHQGRQDLNQVFNQYAFVQVTLPLIKSSGSWKVARELSEQLAASKGPAKPFPWDDVEQYLACFIGTYFERVDAVRYDAEAAEQEIKTLLEFIESDFVDFIGLASLENFSAPGPIALSKDVKIRPITDAEVQHLGRVGPSSWWMGHRHPKTDWWVLEIRLPNPRGTFQGPNGMHKVLDTVALGLRLFKQGNIIINLESVRSISRYGSLGETKGGRPEHLSINAPPYSLDKNEVARLTAFWPKFRELAEKPSHYLQLPARRLRQGGIRVLKEDALVDYMIGLEALLGKSNERVEIGYRFKVRGSVLLSENVGGRRAVMKKLDELYGLRSTVVHGEPVTPEKLSDAIPFAEDALRKVWTWYFDNATDEANNKATVDRIDEDLFGPR